MLLWPTILDSKEIAARYQDKYGDSLWDDIESDTSGDFKGSLKPLVMTQAEYFANTMYYAMVRKVQVIFNSITTEDFIMHIVSLVCLKLKLLVARNDTIIVKLKASYPFTLNNSIKKGAGTDESALVNTLMLALLNDPVVLAGINGYFRDCKL